MFRTKNTQENVLHRLKIARGHLSKIIEMVEEDEYCIDILTQTKAVRSAISKAEEVMLEQHLSHCVVEHVKAGRSKQAVDEVMKIFQER
jgi:CsoR family transcriptional regulator, copper-sensing transcriptional repressor